MSWSINEVGHRAAVKARVRANQNVPPAVKQAIADTIDDVTPQTRPGVRVAGHGHAGGGWSSIGRLEVEAVDLALDVPSPAPEAPPVDNAHVAPGTEKFGS